MERTRLGMDGWRHRACEVGGLDLCDTLRVSDWLGSFFWSDENASLSFGKHASEVMYPGLDIGSL